MRSPNPMNPAPAAPTRAGPTERRLYRSLAALTRDKDYEAIVVREILAHADVARSTFYAHFDGKEALLRSCMQHTLAANRERLPESSDPLDRALGTCLGLLDHIDGQLAQAPVGKPHPDQHAVHRRLERVLVGRLGADLRSSRAEPAAPDVPRELMANHLVSTFSNVLGWWLRRRPAIDVQEAKRVYRALVQPAVSRVRQG